MIEEPLYTYCELYPLFLIFLYATVSYTVQTDVVQAKEDFVQDL